MSIRTIFLGFILISQLSFSEELTSATNSVMDSLKVTNDLAVAEAVDAMSVDETAEGAEQTEAVEVAELVHRAEQKEASESAGQVDVWDAFSPPADGDFDWIQLTSGEWLKGDFKVLYDFVVEFDSDKLDLQEFDFEDVKQLRTRAMKTVFVEGEGQHARRDASTLRGVLVIRGDEVKLLRSEHEVTLPRDRVISIAGGKEHERDYWSGTASVGVNARGGNTETADVTIQASMKRRTARTRFNADYLANYSMTRSDETANNQRLNGYHDWFWTSRFFWKTLEAEYYRDPFSNIDGQYSLSSGVGYDIAHTPRTEWTVNTGLGYQNMKFVSVAAGESSFSDSPFFTAGTRFSYEISGDIDFLYDYSLRALNERNGQYTHHMLATLSFDLIGDLDLDISTIWDRIGSPTPKDDGGTIMVPDQDDYQLLISLGYDF